jgi:hypothetical protein
MGRIESVPPPAPPVVTSEPPKDIVPAFETARGTSASTGDVEGEEEEDESFELGAPSSLMPGRRAGRAGAVATPEDEFAEEVGADGGLRAGDVDVRLDEASMVGDETPGGDNPTPDQDVVDLIGRSLGVEYEDTEELKGADKIAARDRRRWELDPASSEDYRNRSKTKTR